MNSRNVIFFICSDLATKSIDKPLSFEIEQFVKILNNNNSVTIKNLYLNLVVLNVSCLKYC